MALKHLVVRLIRLYQHHLSACKGYGCAYRVHAGHGSGCSGVGLRLVRRHGVLPGLWLLRRRLHRCADAAKRLQAEGRRRRPPRQQRGDCDCGGWDCAPDPGCDLDIDRRRNPVLWWLQVLFGLSVLIAVVTLCVYY